MAVNLSPVGGVAAQFFDNDGNVLSGGKIYTYAAGTSTPQTTYTTSAGSIAHSNPIILNSAGRVPSGEIWLTDAITYKFVLNNSSNTLIATYDNISGINSNVLNFTNQQEIQTATAGQTVFTLTTTQYSPGTNSLSVFVDGVNQYGPGAQYAYTETSSTVVTFVSGLHVGASVKFTTSQINSVAATDAEQVSYLPPFVNSVATNVEVKLSQTVSVADFGAVGDGVTDDTTAIQNAINVSAGKVLSFVRGRIYKITSELDFHTGSEGPKIQGNMATIIAGAAMRSVVYIGATTTVNTQIFDLIIDGNSFATYGLYGILITEQNSLFQNITTKNAVTHGMYLDGCQVMRLHNVRSVSNGANGFLFESCNGTSVTSVRAIDNVANGYVIQRGVRAYSGGIYMTDIDAEFNGEYGVYVVDTLSPTSISSGWLESNTLDGVNIGGSAKGVSVTNLGIIGVEGGGGTVRAIRLRNGAAGCDITNNKFAYAAGGSSVYTIVVNENNSLDTANTLVPNYLRSNGVEVYPNAANVYAEGYIVTKQLTSTATGGAGGYLSGIAYSGAITASGGTSTFTWTPSGDFGIPGASNRGAYFIELDIVGYFSGVDQTVFIRAHIYAGTAGASIFDESSTVVYSYGDSRKANITFGTPTCPNVSAVRVVITNTDTGSAFTGTFTYRTMMTTTGQLTLAVS